MAALARVVRGIKLHFLITPTAARWLAAIFRVSDACDCTHVYPPSTAVENPLKGRKKINNKKSAEGCGEGGIAVAGGDRGLLTGTR